MNRDHFQRNTFGRKSCCGADNSHDSLFHFNITMLCIAPKLCFHFLTHQSTSFRSKREFLVHYKERISLELSRPILAPSDRARIDQMERKVRSIHRTAIERRRAPARSRKFGGDGEREATVDAESTVLTVLQQDAEDEHEVFHGTDRHLPRSRGL